MQLVLATKMKFQQTITECSYLITELNKFYHIFLL